jgi:hypothetical protein
MLVGGMIGNEIENYLKASPVSFFEKAVEFPHSPKNWIDAAIISDVISKIGHRRRINWCHPNRVDAKFHQIVESLDNTIQISYAVSVGVLKRARINLVDYSRLLPSEIVHLTCS